MPVAERAGRAVFQVVPHQPVFFDLLRAQLPGRFAIHKIQDGFVDPSPGIQQRGGIGRAVVEGRKVQRRQQAELPPARVETLAAPGRRGRHHPREEVRQGSHQLCARPRLLQLRIPEDGILDEQAVHPGDGRSAHPGPGRF